MQLLIFPSLYILYIDCQLTIAVTAELLNMNKTSNGRGYGHETDSCGRRWCSQDMFRYCPLYSVTQMYARGVDFQVRHPCCVYSPTQASLYKI
jgi:hypothetical protein